MSASCCNGHGLAQVISQRGAIGQTGQLVVFGEMPQLLLSDLAFIDCVIYRRLRLIQRPGCFLQRGGAFAEVPPIPRDYTAHLTGIQHRERHGRCGSQQHH